MPPPGSSMNSAYLSYFNDPFWRELDSLWVQACANRELLPCHIVLTAKRPSMQQKGELMDVVHPKVHEFLRQSTLYPAIG